MALLPRVCGIDEVRVSWLLGYVFAIPALRFCDRGPWYVRRAWKSSEWEETDHTSHLPQDQISLTSSRGPMFFFVLTSRGDAGDLGLVVRRGLPNTTDVACGPGSSPDAVDVPSTLVTFPTIGENS